MSFISDLKQWEAYELKVAEAIQKHFGIRLEKNENKRGIDLVHPIISLEVKKDRGVNRTGNYFLEFSSNWNTWWITKYEVQWNIKPVFFWIWDDEEFLLFLNSHLLDLFYKWYEDWTYRIIENWWDWWRIKWMLVPRDDLKSVSLYTLSLNKNEWNTTHSE